MMCFNNFDIGVVIYYFGCFFQQFKYDVNVNVKIGSKDNCNIGSGVMNCLFIGFVKFCSVDYYFFVMLVIKSEMVQCIFWMGKIDKYIKIIFYCIEVVLYGNVCFFGFGQFIGVAVQ